MLEFAKSERIRDIVEGLLAKRRKDIATVTAYFSTLYTYDSFFNSIDRAYELAEKFVDKYPPETIWGVEEDMEYEEVLYKFFKENTL
jgi:hypothetical protein